MSHSAENFRRGILCCNIFGYRKSLDKRCGEYHDFPSNNFCLTVPKIFVGEPFSVALISGIEKVWIGRGEYQDFPSKNFCLTVLKISLWESFTVALISVSKKVWIRRVGVSRYSVENFLSHSAEKFRRGILYCCSIFGYRESLDRTGRWKYQDFPSKKFCLTVSKSHVGESFIVALISGSEKVYGQQGGGEYQDFP